MKRPKAAINSIIMDSFSENGNRRSYYAIYSILFVITAFFCFIWFIIQGKTLIWRRDGWSQHYTALVYYAQYLRTIIKHLLFDHKLIIPDWDFYIGEGSDIFTAFHYYVIGDPISLLSVLVPIRFMHFFYSFACILRLYLAGIAFSALCFGTGQKNRFGILAGSLAYCFCYWGLLNAARHPFFLNPMIYFPLMILGIEKIIRREKPFLFIASAAVSAASNFYFFYMIAILAVTYTVIRLGFIYKKQIGKGVLVLLRLGYMAVTGVCMAGIILLPILMMLLHDSRLSTGQPFHWIYPMSYYSQLPSVFITGDYPYWLCMGFATPVLLAVFVLLIRKNEHLFLKILFCVSVLIILFPIGGRILNGMSYMANRWSWAFSLLCAYILVCKWTELTALSKKEWVQLLILCAFYLAVCCLFEKSRSVSTFSAISLLFISLFVIKDDTGKKQKSVYKQVLLLLMIVVGVINVSFFKFAPVTGNHAAAFMDADIINGALGENEAAVIKALAGEEYTRFSGRSLTKNANIMSDISSTQYYWTNSNPFLSKYRSDLELREPVCFNFLGYDERTTPLTLSAVQYYSVAPDDDSKTLPYGFTPVEDPIITPEIAQRYSILKNEYSLPIAYCYDRYFSKEIWDSYNPVQKQEVQLEAAYIDSELDNIEKAESVNCNYMISYQTECQGTGITQTDDCFIVTENNAQVKMTLQDNEGYSETYVEFSGLEFDPTAEYDLYFGDESVDPSNLYDKEAWENLSRSAQNKIKQEKFYWNSVEDVDISLESSLGTQKVIHYLQPESAMSSGRHDFVANLGYSDEPITTVTITFPLRGVYSFTDLKVYSVSMEGYAEEVTALQQNTLQNIQLDVDKVTGTIALEDNKILCLATPFSTGWEAFVDGQKTVVYCLNERYPGIVLTKGSHTIEFRYHTPFKKEGACLTVLGFGGAAWIVFLDAKKRKKKREREHFSEKDFNNCTLL